MNVRKCESSGRYEKAQENVKWVRNSALDFLLGAIASICYTTQTHRLCLSHPLCRFRSPNVQTCLLPCQRLIKYCSKHVITGPWIAMCCSAIGFYNLWCKSDTHCVLNKKIKNLLHTLCELNVLKVICSVQFGHVWKCEINTANGEKITAKLLALVGVELDQLRLFDRYFRDVW